MSLTFRSPPAALSRRTLCWCLCNLKCHATKEIMGDAQEELRLSPTPVERQCALCILMADLSSSLIPTSTYPSVHLTSWLRSSRCQPHRDMTWGTAKCLTSSPVFTCTLFFFSPVSNQTPRSWILALLNFRTSIRRLYTAHLLSGTGNNAAQTWDKLNQEVYCQKSRMDGDCCACLIHSAEDGRDLGKTTVSVVTKHLQISGNKCCLDTGANLPSVWNSAERLKWLIEEHHHRLKARKEFYMWHTLSFKYIEHTCRIHTGTLMHHKI